jgi:hypothetical protein
MRMTFSVQNKTATRMWKNFKNSDEDEDDEDEDEEFTPPDQFFSL